MRDEDLITYEREAYLTRQRRRWRQAARRRAQARFRRLRVVFLFLLGVLLTIFLVRVDAGGTQEQVTGKLEKSTPAAAPAILDVDAQEPGQVKQDEELPLSYLGEFRITHYCACKKCCGKEESDPWYGITATGTVATEGRTIAVDPDVIPYGSRVSVFYDDGRIVEYIAEDCGGAIDGLEVDVFIADHERARELGVKSGSVYLVNEG